MITLLEAPPMMRFGKVGFGKVRFGEVRFGEVGFVRIQCEDVFKFSINPYLTRGNHFKLVMPIARNNNLSNMFACRCVGIWNTCIS